MAITSDDSVRAAPMAAGGAYNRNSQIQAAGLIPALALLERVAAAVELPDRSQPIVIADYGCSAGRNSLAPVSAAIESLRARGNHPITVVHIDLPDNDFSALFDTLWNDPASYTPYRDVFPAAIGRSFYQQVLPAETVTLGWSSWSVAWLSRSPAVIADHVQVSYSADAALRSIYARQAALDWRAFLSSRSTEMRAGARLVVIVPAADDHGTAGYRPLFESAWAGLGALVADGLIDKEEAVRMGMPHYGRSATDLAEPFDDDGSFEGLTIEHLDTFDSADQFWQDYQSSGDAETYGARWAGIYAAGAFPSLATGLNRSADDSRRAVVFERLEAEIASRLSAAPERMRIPVANVVLAKVRADR